MKIQMKELEEIILKLNWDKMTNYGVTLKSLEMNQKRWIIREIKKKLGVFK